MNFKNMEESIIAEAVAGLGIFGIKMQGPLTIRKKAKGKDGEDANKLYKLADNLEIILEELSDASGCQLIHHEESLIVGEDYVWKILGMARDNSNEKIRPINPSNAGWAVGGISHTLAENIKVLDSYIGEEGQKMFITEGHKASKKQFTEIIDLINVYVKKDIITGTSIPVLAKELSHFEMTKKMYETLSGIPIKTWLHGASDEILREVAGWNMVYDSYCPTFDALSFESDHFWDMMRSVKAGNDMGITLMPRAPMWGVTPRLCFTTAMMEFFALLACCLTLNPEIKIMAGVMFEVLKFNGTKDAHLLATWAMNAYLGQIMDKIGVDYTLSSGAISNHANFDTDMEKIRRETIAGMNFFDVYSRQSRKRHFGGHASGLDEFSIEDFKFTCEHVVSNGYGQKAERKVKIPYEPSVIDLLKKPEHTWRVADPRVTLHELNGLGNFLAIEKANLQF